VSETDQPVAEIDPGDNAAAPAAPALPLAPSPPPVQELAPVVPEFGVPVAGVELPFSTPRPAPVAPAPPFDAVASRQAHDGPAPAAEVFVSPPALGADVKFERLAPLIAEVPGPAVRFTLRNVTFVDSDTNAAIAESPGALASAEPTTSTSSSSTAPVAFVTRNATPFEGESFGFAPPADHAQVSPP